MYIYLLSVTGLIRCSCHFLLSHGATTSLGLLMHVHIPSTESEELRKILGLPDLRVFADYKDKCFAVDFHRHIWMSNTDLCNL